jgi:serine/threonine-protein kinase HipA
MMPLQEAPYEFPALPRETFKGLPGLLADSLPDNYGNALIDAWLGRRGRTPESFNPVERLCYTGARGMGALEFKPTMFRRAGQGNPLEIAELVELGARAKAILAWNEETGEFRSGQVPNDDSFTYWLMKFDGIDDNRDKEIADPQGYGLTEYAYYRMAIAAGVEMSECRLHREGGRAHFMTKRFDRTAQGHKLHMQSLCAMMHFDFNQPDAYSYEQALQTIRRIDMPVEDVEQQFRRAVFNVIARNHDDHVKNIAYLMNKSGEWRLSPAFDVAYSYNPSGAWTSRHQMSINGKRDGFEIDDLLALGKSAAIKPARARGIIDAVADRNSRC